MSHLTRHEKREIAFQLLFESEFQPEKTAEEIYALALDAREIPDDEFIRNLFLNARAAAPTLDGTIGTYATNWKVSRMSVVSRSVLRLAAYELTETDTPPRVVINEAVELAKTYDDDEGFSFVNGILNRFARDKGYLTEQASDEQ